MVLKAKTEREEGFFLMVFSPLESREGKSKNSFVLRWRQLAAEGRRTAMFSGTIVVTVEKPQLLSSQFPPFFSSPTQVFVVLYVSHFRSPDYI